MLLSLAVALAGGSRWLTRRLHECTDARRVAGPESPPRITAGPESASRVHACRPWDLRGRAGLGMLGLGCRPAHTQAPKPEIQVRGVEHWGQCLGHSRPLVLWPNCMQCRGMLLGYGAVLCSAISDLPSDLQVECWCGVRVAWSASGVTQSAACISTFRWARCVQ